MKSRWLHLCVTAALILALLSAGVLTLAAPDRQDNVPSGSEAAQKAAQRPVNKVESALQAELETRGKANMFIHFMNGRIQRTQFQNLCPRWGDKAAIRCASTGG